MQGLTNRGQQDEADAVCYHRSCRADLCRVQEEEWPDIGRGVSNEGPANVERSRYQERKEIAADALRPRQYRLRRLGCLQLTLGRLMLLRKSTSIAMMTGVTAYRLMRVKARSHPSPKMSLTTRSCQYTPLSSAISTRDHIPTWTGKCHRCRIPQLDLVRILSKKPCDNMHQVMRPRNEPVNRRVHERVGDGSKVEQGEVELVARVAQVSGQGHEPDDGILNPSIDVVGIGVVQVGERP